MIAGIRIEQASTDCLHEIMEIENACFGEDAFSCRQMIYLIHQSKGIFFTAHNNNNIAGYISFIISRRHNTGRIYSIAVAHIHRGHGVAEALIDSAIVFANKKSLRAIFLEVRTNNTAAINLYKKKGFIIRSIKKNYYHDGAAAYKMSLVITDTKEDNTKYETQTDR